MALGRIFTGPVKGGRLESPAAAAHAVKVLRLRNGDTFAGCDGKYEYGMKLLGAAGAGLEVEVLWRRELPAPAAEVILAPALLKGPRWEALLEKAVELGASAVLPVAAERCVSRLKGEGAEKLERWKKIMEEASAQCAGRLPALEAPAALREVAERVAEVPNKYILVPGGGAAPAARLLEKAAPGGTVVLVGPEGDWTREEIEEAEGAGFERMSLGPRILRSETAAWAALAVVAACREKQEK